MDDIFVFETAHDLNHGVGFADVGEKLIAQAFAFRRAAHESGDIDKFDRRGNDLLRLVHFFQNGKPFVRHGDDADIRLDRGKRIIGRERRFLRGQRVKKVDFPTLGNPTIPACNIKI